MTRGRIIAAVVVLVIVAAVAYGVIASAGAATSVSVATVTRQDLSVTVTASGKTEADVRRDVYPVAQGILARVQVTDGQKVSAGDVLASLQTGPLSLAVSQAASQLDAARAQLSQVDAGVPSAIDRAAASAAVAAAEAQYSAVSSAYHSLAEALAEATASVRPSLEASLTALGVQKKQAYAALQSARSSSGKLTAAARISAARTAASAAVDAAQSALSLAKSNFAGASMVAPIDGVVVFNPVGAPGTDGATPKAAAGVAVSPAAAPFSVEELSPITFDAQVDEADVASVGVGMKATVSLDAFPAATFPGTVSVIRPTAIQTTTGGIAFPVLVTLDPTTLKVLVGMSGSVDIVTSDVPSALVVPTEAVLDQSGGKYVFVVNADDTVTRTAVQVGAITDTYAEITSGLTEGQRVATSDLSSLKDGSKVKPQ